jgi:myo-inositol-1(or 4)-monophosphatase
MQAFITAAQDVALLAGLLLKENCLKNKQVEIKANMVDLVTNVDKAADRLITDMLRSRFPAHKFIAEESARSALTARIVGISIH